MFDLEKAVLGWRESQEREASLAPCELDELEDHLRARLDVELDAALAPAAAFAIARRELGEAAALSKEFAKAGTARWRRWLVTGWAMFAASFFLPVVDFFFDRMYGFDLVREIIEDLPGTTPVLLVNLAMIATVPVFGRARLSSNRWLRRTLGAVGVLALLWAFGGLVYGSIQRGGIGWLLSDPPLLVGFWAWSGSFLCVAKALGLRASESRAASPGKVLAS